jgi:uncharacterized protein (DUF2384 family)
MKEDQKIKKDPKVVQEPAIISYNVKTHHYNKKEGNNKNSSDKPAFERMDYSGYTPEDYLDPNKIAFEYLYRDSSFSKSNLIFKQLTEITHLTNKILANHVFELTAKTLNSYKNSESKIPMRVRELSIKLSELYMIGNRVFGSPDNFNEWLKKPSYGLGGIVPLNLINTITGIDMIFDELVSIEFGTTA